MPVVTIVDINPPIIAIQNTIFTIHIVSRGNENVANNQGFIVLLMNIYCNITPTTGIAPINVVSPYANATTNIVAPT